MSPWTDPNPWFALVIDALATFRLTRLVSKDVIVRGPREWLIARSYRHERDAPPGSQPIDPGDWDAFAASDDNAPKLAKLLTCPWCVGVWMAAGVTALRSWLEDPWSPVAWIAAVAAVAGALTVATDD